MKTCQRLAARCRKPMPASRIGALACLMMCCLVGVSAAHAQDTVPLIPRTDLFDGVERTDFKADVAGKRLLFRRADKPTQILFVTTDDPQVVNVLESNGAIVSWAACVDGIVCLYQAEDGRAICTISWDGERRDVDAGFEFQSARLINARGGKAVFSITASEDADSGIYVFDEAARTLKKRHALQPYANLFFDGEFNLVAAQQNRPGAGAEFFLFDAEEQEWQPFLVHEWSTDVSMLGGFSKIVSVSDDGSSVYYTSNAESDKTQFYKLDVPSKQPTLLAKHELVDLIPFGFSTDAAGDVTSVVGLFAKTIRVVTNQDCEEDFALVSKRLAGDVGFVRSCQDDRRWVLREFLGGLNRYYVFDRNTKALTPLIEDMPSLAKAKLAARHVFSVTTRDELQLPVHVYLPPGSDENNDGIPDEPLPTVMYVHGGPWAGIVHWNQQFHCRNFQLLANRGYAVINCEFRGSVGMGKKFVEASQKTWRTEMTLDKADIANWAIKNKIAAKDKLAIWGWSYGGYATMAGLAYFPDLYACGVSMYGISDLEAFGRTAFANNAFWHNWVGNPFDEADVPMLKDASPIRFVDQYKAPILLTTGSQDARVPQKQLDDMAAALAEADKDVTYFYYPEEVHDYRAPESWISFWAITEKFLANHLGGRYEHSPADVKNGNFVVVHGKELVESVN